MNKEIQINYSFGDETNYKYELNHTSREIFNVYINIIHSYIKHFIIEKYTDSIYSKNRQFYYHLFNKGISTIGHIFKILLMNTKNLDFSEYYCRKSINYYIEFLHENNICHENEIDYNHASLFIYRNTVYNLNKNYRKINSDVLDENNAFILYNIERTELKVYKNVEYFISLHQKIIDSIIVEYNKEFQYTKEKELLYEYIKWNMDTFIDNILSLNEEDASVLEENYNYKLTFIIDVLHITNITSISIINALISQVKERRTAIINKAILIKNLLSEENKIKKETLIPSEYIIWLLF
jgi:hypothetical protein